MNHISIIRAGALAAVCVFSSALTAQSLLSRESAAASGWRQRFRANNASMAGVQPTWMGPLVQSDARLSQSMRFSVSNASQSGARLLNYGNNHGVSVIVDRRFQIDFDPPSFFRNHSRALPDGFGNAGTQVKWRIASGDAKHGNYAVSAVLYHAFAPRVAENQMCTAFYVPSIAAGHAFGRFAALTTVGGLLPTGKTDVQGRSMEWNLTAQMRAGARSWFDIESNAEFYRGGSFNGKTQNFLTPAAFYMMRHGNSKPAHAAVIFDGGMQIATSSFHFYNHNLITEMRVLF